MKKFFMATTIVSFGMLVAPVMFLQASLTTKSSTNLGTFTGTVTINDPHGAVLSNAKISLKPGKKYGYTDKKGVFRISKIKPGKYSLSISKSGYQTYTVSSLTIKAGVNSKSYYLKAKNTAAGGAVSNGNFIDGSIKNISVKNNTLTVDAGDYKADFSMAGDFKQTYMLYGGQYLEMRGTINTILLVGLEIADARRLHATYPDLTRCASSGTPAAGPFFRPLSLISANAKVRDEIRASITETAKNVANNGERVCVSFVGKTLDLQATRWADPNINTKDQHAGLKYYLVYSSKKENCRYLIEPELAAAQDQQWNFENEVMKKRDAVRSSDVNAILNAIGQNIADNKGTFKCAAGPIPTTPTNMGSFVGYNIAACIAPKYISQMPVDPFYGSYYDQTKYNSNYTVMQDPSTRRITVSAKGELAPVSATR